MVNAEFKAAIAEFFNNHIEEKGMTFGSFAAKAEWAQGQIQNKTPLGYAAVKHAMKAARA